MLNVKKRFIAAYCWMFGTTKTEAEKVYKTSTREYIDAVIITYDAQCRLIFCFD